MVKTIGLAVLMAATVANAIADEKKDGSEPNQLQGIMVGCQEKGSSCVEPPVIVKDSVIRRAYCPKGTKVVFGEITYCGPKALRL